MTIRSILELLAQADATLEDNTTGNITPADVRNLIKDFLDTMSPAYGVITCTSSVEALTATPAVISPFTSILAATVGYFTANLTAGSVTRALNGIAGASVRFTLNGDVAGANNTAVTISIYKNGAPTGFQTTVATRGAANPVSFNIAGLTYNDTDAVYDVRAITDTNGSYTFSNVVLLCEDVPVRSFV
jgi:hypothetical protein